MSVLLCFILFAGSVLMVTSQGGHFFMILLSFEVMTLVLFLSLAGCVLSFNSEVLGLILLVFLVFGVCEASLGLGLLVSSMRGQGFDYVKTSLGLTF